MTAANASVWLRWFRTYEPLPTARRMRQPVLILHGALDRQVPVGQADTLEQAMLEAGNSDVTKRVYPRLNHLFLESPTDGSPAVMSPLVDPRAVAADSRGNLYILERGGNALRLVRPDGTIHSVAGTGERGHRDGPVRTLRGRRPGGRRARRDPRTRPELVRQWDCVHRPVRKRFGSPLIPHQGA